MSHEAGRPTERIEGLVIRRSVVKYLLMVFFAGATSVAVGCHCLRQLEEGELPLEVAMVVCVCAYAAVAMALPLFRPRSVLVLGEEEMQEWLGDRVVAQFPYKNVAGSRVSLSGKWWWMR
jgi:hypothetical protein